MFLKVLLYFFGFIFFYNFCLYITKTREGMEGKCSGPTVTDNNARITLLEKEVKELNELRDKVNKLTPIVEQNQKSILNNSKQQASSATEAADSLGLSGN